MHIVLPAMGEGVIEATINKWLVKEGSSVKEDDPLVEVATDKVDSEYQLSSGCGNQSFRRRSGESRRRYCRTRKRCSDSA
jgi:hypothetical protein